MRWVAALAVLLVLSACGGTRRFDQLAFASYRGGEHGIDLVAVDRSGIRRLALGTAADPVWSPDGRLIAYFRDRSDDRRDCLYSACIDLDVMTPEGSGKHRLTSFTGGGGDAAWSPDARLLAFEGCEHTCAI